MNPYILLSQVQLTTVHDMRADRGDNLGAFSEAEWLWVFQGALLAELLLCADDTSSQGDLQSYRWPPLTFFWQPCPWNRLYTLRWSWGFHFQLALCLCLSCQAWPQRFAMLPLVPYTAQVLFHWHSRRDYWSQHWCSGLNNLLWHRHPIWALVLVPTSPFPIQLLTDDPEKVLKDSLRIWPLHWLGKMWMKLLILDCSQG